MSGSNASFTLFRIAPEFRHVQEKGTPAPERPSVPQACTKGHLWNVGFRLVGVQLDLSDLGMTAGMEEYCFLCLRDLLRNHCGTLVG